MSAYFKNALGLALAWTLAQAAGCAPVTGALDRPAAMVARPEQRVMLDLAPAGNRIVGVGERGVVVLSDDFGKSWRQANVPVSVSLTSVAFANSKTGWAIGHGAVVVRTDDGGQNWRRQLDGRQVNQLLTATAATLDQGAQKVARQFAADGPDKPLMSMLVTDERRIMAVGAYGLAVRSDDGGATWHPMMAGIDNPKGLHLYAIVKARKAIWLAGEQGFVATSTDGGNTFHQVSMPYQGSYFSLVTLADGEIVISGLKGNAFRSTEADGSFKQIQGFHPISLSGARLASDGTVFFVNQAGQLYASAEGTQSVRMVPQAHVPGPLSAVLPLADGAILSAGVRGIHRTANKNTQ
jgi:photosystem II stability/assembly factor-like uncharacterized protein